MADTQTGFAIERAPFTPRRGALTPDERARFARDGYLLLDGVFARREVETLRLGATWLLSQDTDRTVFEIGSRVVRSVYGMHQHDRMFAELAHHARLVEPAKELLQNDVYVYQSKLNTKAVFGGDVWPWHQDYVYWLREDSMPSPRALTVAVFLHDVTEVNGPVMVIPRSHRHGIVDTVIADGQPPGYEASPPWIANLVARLKYTIAQPAFVRLATEHPVVPMTACAGSVLIFDANLAHASSLNLSPYERTLALFTYNAVDNAPPEAALHRPEFLVSRDTRPIASLAEAGFQREAAA